MSTGLSSFILILKPLVVTASMRMPGVSGPWNVCVIGTTATFEATGKGLGKVTDIKLLQSSGLSAGALADLSATNPVWILAQQPFWSGSGAGLEEIAFSDGRSRAACIPLLKPTLSVLIQTDEIGTPLP